MAAISGCFISRYPTPDTEPPAASIAGRLVGVTSAGYCSPILFESTARRQERHTRGGALIIVDSVLGNITPDTKLQEKENKKTWTFTTDSRIRLPLFVFIFFSSSPRCHLLLPSVEFPELVQIPPGDVD